jgi:hypothetical protein
MNDEERALQAIKELAKRKVEEQAPRVKRKAENSLIELGLTKEDLQQGAEAAAALKLANDLKNKELNLKANITDNLSVGATISPREKAIRAMYNRSF